MKKMTKRIALLMAALMLLASALVPVFAEGDASAATGLIGYSDALVEKVDLADVADINTYDAANAAKAYKITDVAGFQKFVAIVNAVTSGKALEGVTVYLAADIDLTDVADQKPIGYDNSYYLKAAAKKVGGNNAAFAGIFDGQGFEVKGINISETVYGEREQLAGFFGQTNGATVKNVKLVGVVAHANGETATVEVEEGKTDIETNDICGTAGVAGQASATTFFNVYSNIEVTGPRQVAGFVGRGGTNTVTNCTNAGAINGQDCGAGFYGFSVSGDITACLNSGAVVGNNAAGFIARSRTKQNITNCVNLGAITGKTVCAGGILAAAENGANVTIDNCANYGVIAGLEGRTGAIWSSYSAGTGVCTVNENCKDNTGLTYIPTIVPTADYVGYSSARIEKVDTTNIPDIKNIDPEKGSEGMLDAYKIVDVAGFEHLSLLIDKHVSFTGTTIYLANDVDFSEVENFVPIGYASQQTTAVNANPSKGFNGTFDGQGHMVSGLKVAMTESHYLNTGDAVNYGGISFFGILLDATIKNFIVDGEFAYLADPNDHGCVAGIAFASNNTTFDNCMNMADLINKSRFTGGIVARPLGKTTITNCTNAGTLTGCQTVGGMIGMAGTVDVSNCRNIGKIICTKEVGDEHGTGVLVGSDHSAAGIIAWQTGPTTIENCINNGAITGIDNVAGILGQVGKEDGTGSSTTIKNCTNYGALALENPKDKYNDGRDNTPILSAEDTVYGQIHVATFVEENNVDVRGTVDPTLGMEAITPDYTPEADPGLPKETTPPTTEATTTAKPADTNKPEDTNATQGGDEATTAAPTQATTKAPDATDAPADEKKGCGSTVFGGIAVIMLVSGAAVTLFKKKD